METMHFSADPIFLMDLQLNKYMEERQAECKRRGFILTREEDLSYSSELANTSFAEEYYHIMELWNCMPDRQDLEEWSQIYFRDKVNADVAETYREQLNQVCVDNYSLNGKREENIEELHKLEVTSMEFDCG